MTKPTQDHRRDRAGLTYVYPVVSRRSRGVSIGVNLNPNRACNWRCVYCQVEGLQRGAAPELDLALLRSELDGFLTEVLQGDWLERLAPPEARRINDVALSGDGESTTSTQFDQAVEVIAETMGRHGLIEQGIKLVLITNGSMIHKAHVQAGLRRMAQANGEVWFKLDGGREEDRLRVNDVRIPNSRVQENLALCAQLVRTRIQTCMFERQGQPPSEDHVQAYLDFLAARLAEGVPIQDVMLYGLARDSHQPEASELSPLSDAWLLQTAQRIEALGLPVTAYGAEGLLAQPEA